MDFAIGPTIAETRARAGLTVQELAARARVPAAALAALEKGERVELSTAAVSRIARQLDVDVSDWIGESTAASQPSVFFRQTGVPDFFERDRESVVLALREARSVAVVDALLGRTYKRDAFEPVPVGPVAFEHGYELARRVRQTLGVPVEPLGSISEMIEEHFGVPVVASVFHASNLVALTAKERASNYVAVIVNVNHSTNRRVDLAHEIAHVLFDEAEQEIDYWLDLDHDHDEETSKTEQRAKAFAAELLIPRRGLIEKFGQPQERLQLRTSPSASIDLARRVSEHFGSPPELTTNHLVNNNFIARELRDEVWKSFSASPRPAAPRSRMLHRRLAEALGAGLITQMRARELLGLSARDSLPAAVDPDL